MTTRRRMNAFHRLMERLAYTPFGTWLILNVTTRIDPPLSRATGGVVSFSRLMGLPLALLTTTGAKTGQARTVALIFFRDGDRVIVMASNGGSERHPAWYFNLRKTPRAEVWINGKTSTYEAYEAEGSERARLWLEAVRLYAGYEAYKVRAGTRRIPIMVLQNLPKSESLR